MKLSFEEFGSKNNPPLIILHGFFASARNWRQIARQLADKNHVYVLDQRNHGLSAHDAQMDYPVMTNDLAEFIKDYQLEQVRIIGHSMGGKVAMWYALHWPEEVSKLLVVDIAPVRYQHSFKLIINALKALPLEQISNRKQAEILLKDAIPELSFRQFLLQNLVISENEYRWRIDLNVFENAAPKITGFPDTLQIPPFKRPSFLVAGGKSQHVKLEYHPAIYALFPNCKLDTLATAGHWLHVEQPKKFISLVEEYLAE
jgi:pimeloyl-ACP methyl ester carboxylesterase